MAVLLVGTGLVMGWNYTLTVVNMGLISAIMALGVNLQWGFAGLFNVGVMGFVALGGLAAVLVSMPPVAAAWAKDYPKDSAGRGFDVLPMHKAAMDSASFMIVGLLMGLGSSVLLIACANIANLQLARAAANSKDLAIRSALGASRLRLIGYQLTECLVLALVGGGLGVLVAAGANTVERTQPSAGPRSTPTRITTRPIHQKSSCALILKKRPTVIDSGFMNVGPYVS